MRNFRIAGSYLSRRVDEIGRWLSDEVRGLRTNPRFEEMEVNLIQAQVLTENSTSHTLLQKRGMRQTDK